MNWQDYLRVFLLTAMTLGVAAVERAQTNYAPAGPTPQNQFTEGRVRWGPRPGVTRYRLQLARDLDFTDIVFDRVVHSNEYQLDELAPGRYFWRVAALSAGELE